jgi:hypothetical protein
MDVMDSINWDWQVVDSPCFYGDFTQADIDALISEFWGELPT